MRGSEEVEWNGQGRGGAGEEMEKLEVPAKATELLLVSLG